MTTIYSKAGADAATTAAIAAQGLGTAAVTDATHYATATQGEKADSASQPGHGHAAVAVTVTPAGGISATNVQSALEELDASAAVGIAPGSVVAVLGDSQVELTTWTSILATLTGAAVHQLGFGGARLSTSSSSASYNALSIASLATAIATATWTDQDAAVADLIPTGDDNTAILAAIKAVDWTTVDWLLVFAGTNDFGGPAAVGTLGDGATTSVRGAMRHIITTIGAAFPTIRMAFITPPFRSRQAFGDGKDSDTYPNALSEWLWETADAIIDTARRQHVPCLDLHRVSGINAETAITYLSDGLHLNPAADERVGRLVAQFLSAPITAPPTPSIRTVGGGYNIGIGDATHTLPPTGQFNMAIGSNAHKVLTSGSYNTATGLNSGQSLTTGSDNAQIGYAAGRLVTTGTKNVHIGSGSGYYGAGVVANATTTANSQVVIGYRAGQGSATQLDNIVAIGAGSAVSGARGTAIGSAATVSGHTDSVALGSNTTTTAAKQLELGARHIEITEVAAPGAAVANGARLYAKDDGAGKTQLVVIFQSGAEIVLATEA